MKKAAIPKRSVQKVSTEYLKHCAKLSYKQRAQFVEDFKKVYFSQKDESVAISLRMQRVMLNQLKDRAEAQGIKYQTLIKDLIRQYLSDK